jgi:L-galactose dehydrogenase
MIYRKLGRTTLEPSLLSFGASPLGNEFGEIDAADGERAVDYAIDHGINFFDVAPYYGRTLAEERLGAALEGKRQKIMLATKCCRYDVDNFDFSAQRVETSIDESLRRLRTDYVDIFQVHDIEFGDRRQIIDETIPAMRKVQQTGKARYVGITGFQLKILRDVASQAPVDTILSYGRYNLMASDLDVHLTPLAREQGIGLINASPLHLGILTETGAPGWHLAAAEVKEAGGKIAALCREHGVNVSDVAIRFAVSHPFAATTLVGLSRWQHAEQNLRALDSTTDPMLLEQIAALVAPVKNKIWHTGRPENLDYPES